MIIYQVVLLASKPKVFMDENEFFDRKVLGVVLFKDQKVWHTAKMGVKHEMLRAA